MVFLTEKLETRKQTEIESKKKHTNKISAFFAIFNKNLCHFKTFQAFHFNFTFFNFIALIFPGKFLLIIFSRKQNRITKGFGIAVSVPSNPNTVVQIYEHEIPNFITGRSHSLHSGFVSLYFITLHQFIHAFFFC